MATKSLKPNTPTTSLDIARLIKTIRSNIFKVLGCGLLVLVLVVVVTLKSPILYRSTASVLFENFNRNMIMPQDTGLVVTLDVTKAQRALLESRPVIFRAYEIAGIALDPNTAYFPASFDTRMEGQLFYLNVTDTDPKQAANLANAWSQSFVEAMAHRAQAPSLSASNFLEHSLPDLRKDWVTKQEALNKFERETNFDFTEFENHPVRTRSQEVSNRLTEHNITLSSLQAELEIMTAPGRTTAELLELPHAKRNQEIMGYQHLVEERRGRLFDTMEKFRADSPEIISAQKSLSEAQAALAEAAKGLVQQVAVEIDEIKRERDLLLTQFEESEKNFEDLKSKASRFRYLQSESRMAEKLYSDLAQKRDETTITGAFEGNFARQWETAQPNPIPFKPNWLLNMSMGSMVAVFCSLGCAVFLMQKDDKIRNVQELSNLTGSKTLGSVPAMNTLEDPFIYVNRHPESVTTRRLREIHSMLELKFPPDKKLSITVTSVSGDEGASFVCSNLAILYAQQGRKVLVVDSDLKERTLTRAFKLNGKTGLCELLATRQWQPEFAMNGSTPGFYMLPSISAPDSNNMLRVDDLAIVLKQIHREYDVILFDSAPILTWEYAIILSHCSECTLLIAESGITRSPQAKNAIDRLAEAEARQVFTILNG